MEDAGAYFDLGNATCCWQFPNGAMGASGAPREAAQTLEGDHTHQGLVLLRLGRRDQANRALRVALSPCTALSPMLALATALARRGSARGQRLAASPGDRAELRGSWGLQEKETLWGASAAPRAQTCSDAS